MCLVVLFSDFGIQYQSEDSVSEDLFQADHGYNTCRRPFSSSFGTKGRTTTVPCSSLQTTFKHQEEESRYYGAKSSSQCRSVCKRPVVCVPLNGRQRREPLMLGKRTCFLDAATMGFCAVHRRVRFTMEVIQGRLLIWRNSALDTINQHC
ncbi:uncharacterized protein TNCV_4391651 [Trichonephila clavipes]|nr:uncharacterized protein TNCV_4391651 [Trichonephila clavipes]